MGRGTGMSVRKGAQVDMGLGMDMGRGRSSGCGRFGPDIFVRAGQKGGYTLQWPCNVGQNT